MSSWNPFAWLRARKRARILASPPPAAWDALVAQLPFVTQLTEPEAKRLRDITQVMVAERTWEGCGGLALTDEIRVTIAAQAARLLLGLEHDYFRSVTSILVYPNAFIDPQSRHGPGGVVSEGQHTLGEAWQRGPVILAWDSANSGVVNSEDGRNLVYHEFGHKLDMLDGFADGCPPLRSKRAYRDWHQVMVREYESLRDASEHRRATLLDKYGTVNPAEFFAVATECFFEKARTLQRRHPELYGTLSAYYRQDPAHATR